MATTEAERKLARLRAFIDQKSRTFQDHAETIEYASGSHQACEDILRFIDQLDAEDIGIAPKSCTGCGRDIQVGYSNHGLCVVCTESVLGYD